MRCRRCRARLGCASTHPFESEDACLLELHAVCGAGLQEGTLLQPLPFCPALPAGVKDALAELVDLAQAQSHSRFALLPHGAAGKGANAPHVLLWLPSLAAVCLAADGVCVAQGAGRPGIAVGAPAPQRRLRALFAEGCLHTLSASDIGGMWGAVGETYDGMETAGPPLRQRRVLNVRAPCFPSACRHGCKMVRRRQRRPSLLAPRGTL